MTGLRIFFNWWMSSTIEDSESVKDIIIITSCKLSQFLLEETNREVKREEVINCLYLEVQKNRKVYADLNAENGKIECENIILKSNSKKIEAENNVLKEQSQSWEEMYHKKTKAYLKYQDKAEETVEKLRSESIDNLVEIDKLKEQVKTVEGNLINARGEIGLLNFNNVHLENIADRLEEKRLKLKEEIKELKKYLANKDKALELACIDVCNHNTFNPFPKTELIRDYIYQAEIILNPPRAKENK